MSARPSPGVDVAPIDRARWPEALALLEASVGLPRFARVALEGAVFQGWTGQALVDAFNVATVTLAPPEGEPVAPGITRLLRAWADATGGSMGAASGGAGVRVSVRAFVPREVPLENDPERTGLGDEGGDEAGAWVGQQQGAARASERLMALMALGVRAPLEVVVLLAAAGATRAVRARAVRVRSRAATMRALYLEVAKQAEGAEGARASDAAIEGALARWSAEAARGEAGARTAIRGVFRTQNALHLVDLCDDRAPSELWVEATGDGPK